MHLIITGGLTLIGFSLFDGLMILGCLQMVPLLAMIILPLGIYLSTLQLDVCANHRLSFD